MIIQEAPTNPEDFPINEDLSEYEVPYYPEEFTEDERQMLSPFFTNLDGPVFIITNLPEEVVGALCSRYSRTTGDIRRVFLQEYLIPIVQPELQKDWEKYDEVQQGEMLNVRDEFYAYVNFLKEHGGLDKVVNLQRAQAFYSKWLSEFGDDSIAEMGTSVALCIEGISNLAVNTIQGQRIGVSSLEKSSRYVPFGDKNANGEYKYVVPGEIRGTELEEEYREVMNLLFDTYNEIFPIHLQRVKELNPRREKEPANAYERSMRAKVFDDLRELLPFSTQTSLALNISGRAAEQLVNRLLSDPNGETRWWGQLVAAELQKVIPSFIERPVGKRGAEQQLYRKQSRMLAREMARNLPAEIIGELTGPQVSLLSHTPDPDVEVLARFIYTGSENRKLEKIKDELYQKTELERHALLNKILKLRHMGEENPKRESVRFRKPPRPFEEAVFKFDILCRGGDYRDLHRHRMLSHGRQLLTTNWGYDLEPGVAPYMDQLKYVLDRAAVLNQKMAKVNLDASQYSIPFAFLQRFYWTLSARELYWISELRTGPQGRPHYRKILQDLSSLALAAAPDIFQLMMTDYNNYEVSRRESEMKLAQKRGEN